METLFSPIWESSWAASFPRLTTSYCALGPALGINVAELVLRDAMGAAPPPVRPGRGAAVTIDLDPSHV